MSALFAGIDGGQSSTIAMIGDERGRVLGRGAAGACDEVGEDAQSTKLADALHGALLDATKNATLANGSRFASIVAAISGYEGRIYGAQPQLPTDVLKVVHDAQAAHAAAFGGDAGVVVIAGTGSVVYARDERGDEITSGGWGYLFGDEGSGFWLAREAIAAMTAAQDTGDCTLAAEQRAALQFFGAKTLRDAVCGMYSGSISRERIAAFAPLVMRSGRFTPIVQRGAGQLAALALRALDALNLERVALVGGLVQDQRYYDEIAGTITRRRPQSRIVAPRYEPVGGALLMAYKEAGVPVRELTT
jgi:N-acetylglucosamine kinase-like BadF-type ATPase